MGILEDLHCATSARVLIVASWGTSFGHWAAMLNAGCAVVMPQLSGIRSLKSPKSIGDERTGVVGGKHLEPLTWREGLHYVRAARAQWVHVPDLNASALASPEAALGLLNPPIL